MQVISQDRQNAIEIALLLLTALALLFRIFVAAEVLNLFVDYTDEGGPFFVKFHLGAYAIVSVLLVAAIARPFRLRGIDVRLFKSLLLTCGLILALTAGLVVTSGVRATGFLVDTYLVAALAGLLLLTQSREARLAVGHVLVVAVIASAVIAVVEVVVESRLLPFTEGEPVFRPTGLSGHPLALGAHIILVMGFVMLTRWRLWVRMLTMLVLFIGLAASGARLAMIAGALEILLLLAFSPWNGLSVRHRRMARFWAILFVAVLGAVLIVILFSGGLLARFSNSIVDDNFMARVRIYQIFSHVSWRDIMVGMDANDLLALVRARLDLPFVESAPVFITLTLGFPAAIAFTVIVYIFFRRLLAGAPVQAKIAVIVFIIVGLSNNGLATKNPDIVLMTALAVCFLHAGRIGGVRHASHSALSMTSSRPARLSV